MTTRISWADETWNPVTGCSKASPGCDFCYAERGHRRFNTQPFTTVQLHPDRLDKPLRWRKPRVIFVNSTSDLFHPHIPDDYIARVFAVMALTPRHAYPVLTKRHARMASLLANTDFARQVAEEATEIISRTPLRMHNRISTDGWRVERTAVGNLWHPTWPLPNVWLGVSAENQHWADIRLPHLMRTPAAVRFVSYEPALGPVDLSSYLPRTQHQSDADAELDERLNATLAELDAAIAARLDLRAGLTAIIGADAASQTATDSRSATDPHCSPAMHAGPWLDWVIAGGESGPSARPMAPAWPRQVRDQCIAANVPFHFKQWGEYAPAVLYDAPEFSGGRAYNHPRGGCACAATIRIPGPSGTLRSATTRLMQPGERTRGTVMLDHDTIAVRVGTKASGNELDGRTWLQFPACAPDTDCVRAGRAASR
ncbi:MAG: phage Gp37/Gp68 family protein [Pseudonocardia sp.]|nr:phage Gp37/Gp68 family protein [Pseudonocardia sp.]